MKHKNATVSGWLSGKRVRLSDGRSWVRVPAGSYQKSNIKMAQTASLHRHACVGVS